MQAIWILLITLLVGCTASGGYVPVVPMAMKKEMVKELNVTTTVYVEPITGRGVVSKKFMAKGKEVPVILNLDEMSMYVANSLSAELVKRGATLSRDAAKIIRVEVLDADISYSANYSVAGSLEFELSDGYRGSCSFGGTGVKAHRALGGALQWGVANILNHEKVHSFLLAKQTQTGDSLSSEATPALPDYGTKFKMAVLPFKAKAFDQSLEQQQRALDALVAATTATDDIVLTLSWYAFRDDRPEQRYITKIDPSRLGIDEAKFWERDWGEYVPNQEALNQFGTSEKIDLVFTCTVVCSKGGTYCPEIEIKTFLYSVTDAKMFSTSTHMRHSERSDNLAYIHNYYSYDKFYAEIKTMSASLFQEFLQGKQRYPEKTGVKLQ